VEEEEVSWSALAVAPECMAEVQAPRSLALVEVQECMVAVAAEEPGSTKVGTEWWYCCN
jgi:hypothetical protein